MSVAFDVAATTTHDRSLPDITEDGRKGRRDIAGMGKAPGTGARAGCGASTDFGARIWGTGVSLSFREVPFAIGAGRPDGAAMISVVVMPNAGEADAAFLSMAGSSEMRPVPDGPESRDYSRAEISVA